MSSEPAPLRVALFGSGSPLSTAVLEAAASAANLSAVVVPRLTAPVQRSMRRDGIPLIPYEDRSIADRLKGLDLIIIAAFGRKLSERVLAIPRLGTLNVHPSLLPRHRGADPLFWTYFHDDAQAGVSIHWATTRLDGGPIVSQARVDLPRGLPVTELYPAIAERAARLVTDALTQLRTRRIDGTAQDEELATFDPRPSIGNWEIDFAIWPAERLWHFLSGLSPRRSDLLPRLHGRAVRWAREAHDRLPGTIERRGGELRVFARDGYVDLQCPSWRARIRRLFHR